MATDPTPKDRFTSLDALAVVRELRALGSAHVDKAFDIPGGGWSLVLRVPGEGRRELVLVPGRYASVLEKGPSRSDLLSPVAKELRRLLSGAVVRSVAEPGGERLVQISLARGGEPSELLVVLEIFGAGNLLVVRDSKIALAAFPRKWAARTVRAGAEYVPPPRRADPWTLGIAEIESELGRSRTDLISTLAVRLALGGPIAEELILRRGWNAEEAAAPQSERLAPKIHEELARLFSEVGEHPAGFVYVRDGSVVDATPYRSRRWASVPGIEEVSRPSFSEAAHEYFTSLVEPATTEEEREAARARSALERLAEQQREAADDLARTVEQLRAEAEAIFAHYSDAVAALERPRPPDSGPKVETVLGGTPVSLWADRPPRASAQALFEEIKRVQGKLAGARAALEQSMRRLEAPSTPLPKGTSLAAVAAQRRVRSHWFEKYRWFVSSEGAVVVAGRDASSNDLVVKRHLKEGDLYIHADLHGAASVVVKHPSPGEPPISEVTYREAGQWAVAFSKAWRGGAASADAFWVTPDQVSKSSESGEFVARGAWVIRGTKNGMRDLPLELALGTIRYGEETYWTIAPEAAVRRWGEIRALLTPGDERDRAVREVELARDLGISRSLLQSLLPAGGISVRRP